MHSWEKCFIEDQLGLVGKVNNLQTRVGGHLRQRKPLHLGDTVCREETRRSGKVYKMGPVEDIQ